MAQLGLIQIVNGEGSINPALGIVRSNADLGGELSKLLVKHKVPLEQVFNIAEERDRHRAVYIFETLYMRGLNHE